MMNRRTFLRALTAAVGTALGLRAAGVPEKPAPLPWIPEMDDSLRPDHLVDT